jgi:hypothetical protein
LPNTSPRRLAGIPLALAAALLAGPVTAAAASTPAGPPPAAASATSAAPRSVSSGTSASARTAAAATPGDAADLVPGRGVLFGAGLPTTGSSQDTEASISEWETTLARKLDLHRVYRRWDDPVPDPVLSTDLQRGRTPVLSIKPKYRDGRQVTWSAIARGDVDQAIRAQADGLRALGAPLFLSFQHEADLSSNASYGTPAEFVAAWRHYRRVFATRGAGNVAFAWIVTTSTFGTPGRTDTFYPGDDVVDWIGLDAFNWFGCSRGQPTSWRSLAAITAPFAAWAGAHAKPLMLAEWGSVEDPAQPGRKATWLRDALALAKSWPQLKAMSYLDAHGSCPWWLDSTPAAAAAFADVGADAWTHPRPDALLAPATRLGPAPLTVHFDGSASTGTDAVTGAGTVSWTVDFGDGSAPASGAGTPPADLAHRYAAGAYTARLVVVDRAGRHASDSGPIRAAGPPAATVGVRDVSGTAATLRAWVSPQGLAGTARFEWDTTPDYRWHSPPLPVDATTGTVALSHPVTGLTPGSRYYLRVVATTAAGTTSQASTFDTPGAPTVDYRAPSQLTGTSAVVNGLVHPHSLDTAYYVEWGRTTDYGSRTGTAPLAAATWQRSAPASLAGLRPRTTYHYRIVASNAAGTGYGTDRQLSTP